MDPLTPDYGVIDPRHQDIAALIARHSAHGDANYPADSNHHMDGATMAGEGITLFAARLDGVVVGMCGYKIHAPGAAEVKSMHVCDAARGHGVAATLLEMIIEHARAHGVGRLSLETGSLEASAAARRLYERAGFGYCGPFAGYVEDPMSVFMTRAL